jgi:hypothetical protein
MQNRLLCLYHCYTKQHQLLKLDEMYGGVEHVGLYFINSDLLKATGRPITVA